MKKVLMFVVIVTFVFSGMMGTVLAEDKPGPKKVIRTAPPSPRITDGERQTELARRRREVAAEMAANSMMILFSAEPKVYTNDVDYHYRQENNLYYLTALKQNGISLVILKNGDSVDEILFVPKRNPQYETWNGRMYSDQEATRLSGITKIIDAKNFNNFINSVASRSPFDSGQDEGINLEMIPEAVYLVQGNKREFEREIDFAKQVGEPRVRNAAAIFAKLRLIKSPYEVKMIQHAIDITSEALMRSMGMVGRAAYEYEVQAEVEYTFRRRNADYWGYPAIVGCGPNATTLHYVTSQGEVRDGDLMLMDVGAEYEHYTADVTRTFPVNGKFTKEQAEIYQIVYDAQEAAAKELKPGGNFRMASEAASKVIAEGLFKLGLITNKTSGQERIWYMHGWGHWLGMNVHDVGNYGATFQQGMIMTNEPGIYIREDALDYLRDTPENREFKEKVTPVFEKYKNIGVRIEDDMLITKDGVEWMNKDLPRSIRDIEDFMARASKEMKNYATVEKPADSVLAGLDFGGNFGVYEKGFGLLGPQNFLNGQTSRRGWSGKTLVIGKHDH